MGDHAEDTLQFEEFDEDDEEGISFWPERNGLRTCKFCGKGGLVWERFDTQWRLIDPKRYLVHHCKHPTPDAFMDLKIK